MKRNILVIGLAILIISGCDFGDDPNAKPGTPLLVVAAPQANLSILISWRAVKNAESYEVYYETDIGNSIDFLGETTETSYTHENLHQEISYTYYVKAKNSNGESSLSLGSLATKPIEVDNKPRAPYYVSATAKQNSTIEVTWREVSNATSYDVYFETDSSSDKQFLANATETSYTHTGLNSGTTYTYYIKAKNSYGESDFSTKSNSTKPIEAVAKGTSPDDAITITSEGVSGTLIPVIATELWYTFTKNSLGTLSVKDSASGEYSADIMADIYTTPPSTGSNGVFAKINNQDARNLNLGTTGLTSIPLVAGTYYVKVSLYPSLLNMGTFWLSFE